MMLRTKLVASFLGVALLVGVVGVVSITSLDMAQSTIDDEVVPQSEKWTAFHEMNDALHMSILKAFIYHHTGNEQARQMSEYYLEQVAELENNVTRHGTVEQNGAIAAANQKAETVIRESLTADPGDEEAISSLSQIADSENDVMQHYRGVGIGMREELHAASTSIFSSLELAELIILAASFLAMILASITGLLLSNHISRPLHELQVTVERISKGDMDADIPDRLADREDEIGYLSQSFDRTLTSLKLAMHRTSPHLEAEVKKQKQDLKEQSALLESTIDVAQEGLLVVDRDGSILDYNEAFIEMWDLPEELVETADDEELLDYVMEQLKDPEAFREQVDYLYDHPEKESWDSIEFTDGRVLERYSAPAQIDGEIIGRIWRFTDTTDTDKTGNEETTERQTQAHEQ